MVSFATRNLTNCKSMVVTMIDDLHIVKVMKLILISYCVM